MHILNSSTATLSVPFFPLLGPPQNIYHVKSAKAPASGGSVACAIGTLSATMPVKCNDAIQCCRCWLVSKQGQGAVSEDFAHITGSLFLSSRIVLLRLRPLHVIPRF